MNAYEVIWEHLSQAELLAQLAEEAMELGHAALKLRRVYDGNNPTPIQQNAALDNLKEEIADVTLLISVLGLDKNYMERSMIQGEKLVRWINRLKERERNDLKGINHKDEP